MPAGSQKWQRRSEARPQEILDAALALFAEKGFAATRMDEIATRAGVTKGTIYLYFESKEQIFRALVENSIGNALTQVSARVGEFKGASADLLRMVLGAVVDLIILSDRAVLPKVLIAEAGNFPEVVRFYRKNIIDKGLAMMSGIIERGMARGEFRKINPEHVARLVIAPVLLSSVWRTTFEPLDSKPYDYHGLIATHLDVLLRGLAASGDAP